MKRIECGAIVVLAALALAAVACGQPLTTAEQTQTAEAVPTPDLTTTATLGLTTTPDATMAAATATALTPTAPPPAGFTDTGYKAIDESPLFAECIGIDPIARAKDPASTATLPLPPRYPPPGTFDPIPTASANQNPEPRPPEADLPPFDPAAVAPGDASGWQRISTPCLGGFSFAVPPDLQTATPLEIGGYASAAFAEFTSTDGSMKIDLSYFYSLDDVSARFRNNVAGNGTYYLAKNVPVSVGGSPGLLNVSSEIVGATTRYVVVAYLVDVRPGWHLGVMAFIRPPYEKLTFADVAAMTLSARVGP